MIENCSTDLYFRDLTIEGARCDALAEQFGAVHFGLDEAAAMVTAPFLPDRSAESFDRVERLVARLDAWAMKCHHPDAFCAALLNAQPIGFYAPAQIVRDARRRAQPTARSTGTAGSRKPIVHRLRPAGSYIGGYRTPAGARYLSQFAPFSSDVADPESGPLCIARRLSAAGALARRRR